MPFDTQTRNRLARLVTDARELIATEFAHQLRSVYGIAPSGEVTPLADLNDLHEEQRALAELLRDRVEYLKASSVDEKDPAASAVDRLTREQAFTVLNRLAALRMAENRGFILESVGRGYQSKGFQVYSQVAGSGLGDTYLRYRRYLFCLFDEIAVDLGALFDRRTSAGLLFPRETALLALFQLINGPEIDPLWAEDETIGWIYQYYNDEAERKRMRELSAAPRNSRELAVRNQFFTPRYVVEFLVDNTLGRIWYEARKGATDLNGMCRYLVRNPAEVFLAAGECAPAAGDRWTDLSKEDLFKQPVYIPHRPKRDPRDLKILDPACGSGHFLLYSFDLLERIYEEAWTDDEQIPSEATRKSIRSDYPDFHNLRKAIPELIIRHNLHGIDIDLRACQIAGLALWLRAQRSYQRQDLKLEERPKITRSNIVCAEPMPGDKALLEQFVADLQPKVLGQLVDRVFEKMKLAGEAGALLQIESEIAGAMVEAKRLWLAGPKSEQTRLFAEDASPEQGQLGLDLSGISDEAFWDKADEQIYSALQAYAERSEIGHRYQRRLFANDAAAGFAFIELCRQRYDVALMNPPFGDASLPSKPYIDETYGDTRGDVYKAFVECFQVRLVPAGYLGIISSRSGFFLSQSADWRTRVVLRLFRPFALADLGGGVLDAMVETAAYILRSLNVEESRDLAVSLVPTFASISLDKRGQFTVANWEAVRGNLKRHQALAELELLRNYGFVTRVEGPVARYAVNRSQLESAPQLPETHFPQLVCIRLLEDDDKEATLLQALSSAQHARLYRCNPLNFSSVTGSPFAYWVTARVFELFQRLPSFLGTGAEAWMGLSSGRDFQWLRLRWEIPFQLQGRGRQDSQEGRGWIPLSKGGEYSPFYADIHILVNWTGDGKQLGDWKKAELEAGRITENNSQCWNQTKYFRRGATWSRRSQKGLSVRILPAGCIFGDKGPAALMPGDDEEAIAAYVGLFNSSAYKALVAMQVAFGSYEVGAIQRTTVPRLSREEVHSLAALARRSWLSTYSISVANLTSQFALLPGALVGHGLTLAERAASWVEFVATKTGEQGELSRTLDALAFRLYGVADADLGIGEDQSKFKLEEAIEDPEDDDNLAINEEALISELFDYMLGCAFGCWDVRLATGRRSVEMSPGPFEKLPICPPGMLQNEEGLPITEDSARRLRERGIWDYPLELPWSGILADDPEHANDVVGRVREVLNVIWKDRAETIEHEAWKILGVKDLREYFRKPSLFFAHHLRRYSKSRRQAPLYWPLTSPSGRYTLWLYYPRLTTQTLHQCIADFLAPKLKIVSAEIQMLRASNGSQSRLGELLELHDDLQDMQIEIERIIKLPYVPNLNDGTLITASPLWKLFRLPRWQKDLRRCWEELQAGDYDWAHLALSIWPDRVKEKCKGDRSIAITHNLEELCEVMQPKSKAKKSRTKQQILINESAS